MGNQRQAVSVFVGIAAAAVLAATASAVIINVPGDFPTIQAAIDAAVDGDEVVVAPGVYVENLNLLGKAITLRSDSGADSTIVDGDANPLPVVRCSNGEDRNTVIDGFTLTNGLGLAGKGGGIYITSGPTVRNCKMLKNRALAPGQPGVSGSGGGLYSFGGTPIIESCVISGNAAFNGTPRGGGAYIGAGTLLVDCVISGNAVSQSTAQGGGVYCFGGSLQNCIIRFNQSASPSGTGIYCGDRPTLMDCTICSNGDAQIWGPWVDDGGNTIVEECPAKCEPPNPWPADLNGDGCVDSNDLTVLLGAWCSVAGGNPCGTCQ